LQPEEQFVTASASILTTTRQVRYMNDFIEIPASKRSIGCRKLVAGVGINDASYNISEHKTNKITFRCPYYRSWSAMIYRCYSKKANLIQPTYVECTVSDEWLIFSNFKKWMITQDWQGKQIDKDILIVGNKEYSDKACLFVKGSVNGLLTDSRAARGLYPQGVYFVKSVGKYKAQYNVDGKRVHIGCFKEVYQAEIAYLNAKSALVEKIASNQIEAIRNGLIGHASAMKDRITKINIQYCKESI
jgi:hypothetical protein